MMHATSFPSDDELEMSHDRKSHKQEMEKRRRARINESLTQLKSLVLHALKRDETRYSKLEKADILEMTVKYLRSLRRHELYSACSGREPALVARYLAGFNECATEITRLLSSVEGLSVDIRNRMLAHVAGCVQSTQARIELPMLSMAAYPPLMPVGYAGARGTERLLAVATASPLSEMENAPHPAFGLLRPFPMTAMSPRGPVSARSEHSSVSSGLGSSTHGSPTKTCSPLASPSSPRTTSVPSPSSCRTPSISSPVRSFPYPELKQESPLPSPGFSEQDSPTDVDVDGGRDSPVWRPW